MSSSVAKSLRAARSIRASFTHRAISSSSSPLQKFPNTNSVANHISNPSSYARAIAQSLLIRFNQTRCRVNKSGSKYSPLNSSGSDRPPTDMAPLFPGCDYEHWLIVMEKPGGEGATKEQMIECYIQTLAKLVGSEEEAKKKIYNVSCERYYGFGCEIDEEAANRLETLNLPGVLFVLPDSYVDVEHKDYGAELFSNGEIVQRPPDRQRRIIELTTHNNNPRPKYNDRTRYVRRRENMR